MNYIPVQKHFSRGDVLYTVHLFGKHKQILHITEKKEEQI